MDEDELRRMQLHTVKAIYEHEQVAVIDVTGDTDWALNGVMNGAIG